MSQRFDANLSVVNIWKDAKWRLPLFTHWLPELLLCWIRVTNFFYPTGFMTKRRPSSRRRLCCSQRRTNSSCRRQKRARDFPTSPGSHASPPIQLRDPAHSSCQPPIEHLFILSEDLIGFRHLPLQKEAAEYKGG